MASQKVASGTTSNNTGSTGPEWGRRRLLVILVVAIAVAVLLAGGLIRATHLAVTGFGGQETSGGGVAMGVGEIEAGQIARGARYRDEIAAAPMLNVSGAAMFPAETVSDALPGIEIPAGQAPGPAKIQSGFPRSPEGAIGQLAQIDVAVLQAMSLPTSREVYWSWALPGGIGAERWWITQSVAAFLSSTAMGEVLDSGSWVEVELAAALIKGVDGPDWVTVCVLLKVTATYRQEAQVAVGHCERMQWAGGRWMIAPGLPPAPAPSTWPGTQAANQAGWRPWITADP